MFKNLPALKGTRKVSGLTAWVPATQEQSGIVPQAESLEKSIALLLHVEGSVGMEAKPH